MKFVVTGGCGFIGSNCVKLLHNLGHEAIVVDKLTYAGDRTRLSDSVPVVVRGIEQLDWATFLDRHQPDVIINYAAETHVDNSNVSGSFQFIESTVSGVYNIINGLRTHTKNSGKRVLLIQISTDEVYGSTELDSEDEFHESYPYDPSNL